MAKTIPKLPSVIVTQTMLRQSVEYTLRQQETYSPIARNMFTLIHFQMRKKRRDNLDNLFYLYKKDLEILTGELTCTNDMRSGLDLLRKTGIWIDDIRLSTNLIASWQQINGELFEVEMSGKLMHYFININTSFTEYTFENMILLKKKYSKRIYEILSGFSSQSHCQIGLEKFKEYLFIKNLETDKDRYPRWVDFNRKVLEPSIAEINGITELSIEYSLKKDGRRVDGLLFHFEEKESTSRPTQLSLNLDYGDEEQLALEVLQGKYCLRLDQALLFMRKYDFHTERQKLYDVWTRSIPEAANSPRYIANIGAYVAKLYNL